MTELNLIQKIAIYALPLLFAITVHEAAHGYAARRLGDRTAQMLGRLTLNPIKHIDPVGTLLVPLLLLMSGTGFIFGWAKPVPVSPRNFKNPEKDMAIVAVGLLPPKASTGLAQVEPYGMWILVGLMVTGLLSPILWPGVSLVTKLITTLVGF